MRYKTLFRVICKAMGVYFIVLGCTGLLGVAAVRIAFASRISPRDSIGWTVTQGVSSAAAPVFQLAVGLYLFFGGRRIADLALPSNRFYCPECGYDTTGSEGLICPECGTHRQSGQQKRA
jgi:hypothetical protein